MTYKYKLIGEIKYYITTGGIYIIDSKKKEVIKRAERDIYNNSHVIASSGTITRSPFKLKIDKSSIEKEESLLVSNPEIEGGKFFRLANFDIKHLFSIVKSCNISNGEVSSEFYACSEKREDGSSYVNFISKDMKDDWKLCWNEYLREANYTLKPKTKKVKIGHRYDGENETCYVLAKVNSLKFGETVDKASGQEGYIICTEVDPSYTKVSEVLNGATSFMDIQTFKALEKNVTREKDETKKLFFVTTLGTVVDSGEALTDDNIGIYNYWPSFIKNMEVNQSLQALRCTSFGEFTMYENSPISKTFVDDYSEVIKNYMVKNILIPAFGKTTYRSNTEMLPEKSDKNNVEAIVTRTYDFLYCRTDELVTYKSILGKLKLDISKTALTALREFKLIDFSDINVYYKYHERFSSKMKGCNDNVYVKTINSRDKEINLSGSYKPGLVKNTLFKMIKMAQDELQSSSDYFEYLSIYKPYQSKPDIVLSMKINAKNMIDFLGGPDKMTEEDKKIFIESKFQSLTVSLLKTTEIK